MMTMMTGPLRVETLLANCRKKGSCEGLSVYDRALVETIGLIELQLHDDSVRRKNNEPPINLFNHLFAAVAGTNGQAVTLMPCCLEDSFAPDTTKIDKIVARLALLLDNYIQRTETQLKNLDPEISRWEYALCTTLTPQILNTPSARGNVF